MKAIGAVELVRGRARITGDTVTAVMAPVGEDKQPDGPDFVLRTLDIVGRAELVDPENKVAARGRHIAAAFEGPNRLRTAAVSGTADEFGTVYARPYLVRGERIDMNRDAQTLQVSGPSHLAFKTQRSLQGQHRREPTRVTVDNSELLLIDGRRNAIQFVGDVVASSAAERLQGRTLTLLLEDVEEQPDAPTWRDLWRELAAGPNQQSPKHDALDLRASDDTDRIRKEPVRLIAEDALVISESYEPDDDQPAVHASISAPLLEVDVVNRQILTTGLTQLLMTDRRGLADVDAAGAALGIPSALMTRGPSQTAMQCQKRMTYTLGPDGPGRRDTVVFEEGVLFVHRAGREMVGLDQMLPELAGNPDLLAKLKSRNAAMTCERLECWFTMDEQVPQASRAGALTRSSMQLASLLATGGVYLRDEEGSRIRDVNAPHVEFNRELGLIHVQWQRRRRRPDLLRGHRNDPVRRPRRRRPDNRPPQRHHPRREAHRRAETAVDNRGRDAAQGRAKLLLSRKSVEPVFKRSIEPITSAR